MVYRIIIPDGFEVHFKVGESYVKVLTPKLTGLGDSYVPSIVPSVQTWIIDEYIRRGRIEQNSELHKALETSKANGWTFFNYNRVK